MAIARADKSSSIHFCTRRSQTKQVKLWIMMIFSGHLSPVVTLYNCSLVKSTAFYVCKQYHLLSLLAMVLVMDHSAQTPLSYVRVTVVCSVD